MSLTAAQASDAIQDRFNVIWGLGSPLTPVAWDNVPFNASDQQTAWVRISVNFNDGSIATLGGAGERIFRNFGIAIVEVYTRAGSNRVENDTLCNTAKTAFKGIQLTGGLWFRNTRINTIGNEGKWFHQNVISEFIYDESE